jgi:3',5'-cyclic AMP phosphodiesterase CpdA
MVGVSLATAAAATLVRPAAGMGLAPRRVVRFAHMTDTHVQPEREAGAGFAAALHRVQCLADKPDFVFFGGDNVMNVDGSKGADRAAVQLDVWNHALRNELSLPYYHCIGNHDVLRMHPVDGKKWAADAFGLEHRYYAFERAGWKFIVLDSTSPEGGGYKGRLDEAQFEWLGGELAATPAATPVIVIGHIPILAACAYFDGDNEKSGDWRVPGAWMHIDARRIKDLFLRHPNVRLCLSGHIHLVDQVLYHGVTYCCNGAVSGGWWGGPCQEFQNGFGVVDLYDDGSFRNEYVTYEWTARD